MGDPWKGDKNHQTTVKNTRCLWWGWWGVGACYNTFKPSYSSYPLETLVHVTHQKMVYGCSKQYYWEFRKIKNCPIWRTDASAVWYHNTLSSSQDQSSLHCMPSTHDMAPLCGSTTAWTKNHRVHRHTIYTFKSLFFYRCVRMFCLCVMDSLELELQTVLRPRGWWEPNVGPLQEQQMPLITEQALQPQCPNVFYI